jgi:hypothetical protein
MKQAGWFAVVAALVLSAMAGCGGNVTVDGSGGEGAAGGGGGTTTTPTPATYCQSICNQAGQYGCVDPSEVSACVDSCVSLFQQYSQCTTEIYGLYDCAVGQFATSGCNGSDSCQQQANAFSVCVGGEPPTCGTAACSGSQDACSCQGECDGQVLEADCQVSKGGNQCVCLIDGNSVGACNDMSLTCDIYGGCCSAYFFGI